jgi:glyoxylase-like metal-dependent hydrolase (beta-lactamase superfamily II)
VTTGAGEETYSLKVGAIEVLPVIDCEFKAKPGQTFAGLPGDAYWEPHQYLLDDQGEVGSAMGGFLIRNAHNERLMLVDLGMGVHEGLPIKGELLLQNLASYGYAPTDITDVVFTHLHLDHIGWASTRGERTFPNATYRCDAADWHHWVVDPRPGTGGGLDNVMSLQRRVMEPTATQIETWDTDCVIAPGVNIVRIPGHTPGSVLVVLSDEGKRAMLLGDVVHCAVELLDDEWDGAFDVDPVMAKAARNRLVRELEGEDVPVAAAHFPGLRFGRIMLGEQHRRFDFFA